MVSKRSETRPPNVGRCVIKCLLNYSFSRQLNENWKELQLLCLEDELPYSENVKGQLNTVTIPDIAWIEVRKFSKKLKVQLVLRKSTDIRITKLLPMGLQ